MTAYAILFYMRLDCPSDTVWHADPYVDTQARQGNQDE